jgi:cellulose synthase/poly-beta-1,6-N-acetylglucosamine synthase-like glycosyltransferase
MTLPTAVTTIVALAAIPSVATTLYLLTLAVASCFHRPSPARNIPRHHLAVLVPAHNEAEMIARCVQSLTRQGYPKELFQVVVIADNCTDATAEVAARAGAQVLVRREPELRGKGHALRWGIAHILAGNPAVDALVVVDADSIAESHFLGELEARLASGFQVVQADDLVLPEPGSLRSVLEATALLLRNRVRFAGRAVLGLPAMLCGNGMLLSRAVLAAHPWNAFTVTEDGEYSVGLRVAGVRIAYAQNARVLAAATSGGRGSYTQGLRWEAGRFQMMRRWFGPLLRAMVGGRRLGLIELFYDLAVLPLGLVTIVTLLGTGVSLALFFAHLVMFWGVLPWAIALISLPLYVVVGLRGAHAPGSFYRALLVAPAFMVRKLRIWSRLVGGREAGAWVRTERPAESDAPDPLGLKA